MRKEHTLGKSILLIMKKKLRAALSGGDLKDIELAIKDVQRGQVTFWKDGGRECGSHKSIDMSEFPTISIESMDDDREFIADRMEAEIMVKPAAWIKEGVVAVFKGYFHLPKNADASTKGPVAFVAESLNKKRGGLTVATIILTG